MSGLRELAGDLWIAEQPLRFFGLEIGARMTVVRLPGGRLFVHSPIDPTAELRSEVERLGAPAFLVAPNRFHHLYVGRWGAAYPAARVHLAPGVLAKRPDLAGGEELGDAAPKEWSDELDQVFMAGFPLANEVVFFHRASATLIAADLAFHVDARSARGTRLAFRLAGAYGRLSVTPLERLGVRDRAAYRRSLDRVLAWPIARVVVAHGSVVEGDGRAALASAHAWLPDGARTGAP
jgi:hypothetical protein